MKRLLSILLAVFLIANSIGFTAFASSSKVNVAVDGQTVYFPDAQPFIDDNGRTLIPVRFVAEKLGATVEWNDAFKMVTISRGDKVLTLIIGDNRLGTKNGDFGYSYRPMDTAATIIDERTYVPIRFVAEGLGATVDWEDSTSTVTIKSQDIDTAGGGEDKYVSRYTNLNPVFGVAEDKEFIFNFNSNLNNGVIQGMIQVFADAACKHSIATKIEYVKMSNEGSTVKLLPPEVNNAPRMKESEKDGSGRSWGGYNKYYIIVNRDMESSNYAVLDKPLRMMFTVETEAEIPEVRFKVSEDGLATLYWDKVAGVSEYRIYSSTNVTDMGELTLLTTTKDTQFNNFTEGKYSSFNANSKFYGAYYVTSVVNGKESRISNQICSEDVESQVPKYKESIVASVNTLNDLPNTFKVQMADYNTYKNYTIKWDYANLKYDYDSVFGKTLDSGLITYTVPGTVFNGSLRVMKVDKDLLKQLQGKPADPANSGVIQPEDKIKDNPPPDVKTDTGDDPVDVKEQMPTQEPKTALEIVLETSILNYKTEIPLEGYPEAADTAHLKDVLLKVRTQNPFILKDTEFGYNYETQTLLVKYSNYNLNNFSKKIDPIKAKVKEVVAKVIKPSMSYLEKEKALHDYLMDNGRYDFDALKEAEKTNFKSVPESYEDSFNAYGILIKGVGVCASYGDSYKLLCDEAGLDCVVVTGILNNGPHEWNKVKIGSTYYTVDATNNDDNAMPYPVFNASDTTIKTDFTEDKDFALDDNLPTYVCSDNSQDYYTKQGMTASTKEELKNILSNQMDKGTKFNIKIMGNSITSNDIIDVVKQVGVARQFSGYKLGGFSSVIYGEFVR